MSVVQMLKNPILEHGDKRLFVGAETEIALTTEIHTKSSPQSTTFKLLRALTN